MVSQNTGNSLEYAMDVPTIYETDDGATVVDKNSKPAPMGAGAVLNTGTEIDKPTAFDSAAQSVPTEDGQTKYDMGNAELSPVPQKKVMTIKRVLTGERVRITGSLFRIGRKDEGVDYVVSHNPFISSRHAEILERNGRYFIRDIGSKNGTFVNGRKLSPNKEIQISNGDLLKFANEDFFVLI